MRTAFFCVLSFSKCLPQRALDRCLDDATGQALVALEAAGSSISGLAYRRGVAFLLRTQFPDGSWLVRTRTFPVQPRRDSGFPHGQHQWISAAGTSWATMALALALPGAPNEPVSPVPYVQ